MGEEGMETVDHVWTEVTTVVDDQVQRTDTSSKGVHEFRVTLISSNGLKPRFVQFRLIEQIQSINPSTPKKVLPHPKRSAPGMRDLVTANANLKDLHTTVAKLTEMPLVKGSV